MKQWQNTGTADRWVRGVVGIVLLALAGLASLGIGWTVLLVVVAAILLVTGAVAYCPAYAALGIRTTGTHGGQPRAA